MAFAGKNIAHTHNNGTKSLTFTKKRQKPKIVKTDDYNCAKAINS